MIVDEEKMRTDFAEYTDINSLLQNKKDPSEGCSGNGLLFTSHKMVNIYLLGLLKGCDVLDFNRAVSSCEVAKGLYDRSRNDRSPESLDDYVGVVSASARLASRHRFDVLDYGKKYRWCFNNTPDRFQVSSWLGRFPAFIAHCYFAANERPNMILIAAWAVSIATCARSNPQSQDEWLLSWHLINTYRGYCAKTQTSYWVCDAAVKKWKNRFAEAWPGGMKAVAAKYFNDPEHPLAKYFVDIV